MKKHLCLTFLILTLQSTQSLSQLGGVVTDPGSYAYYAEQIAQATEFVQTQIKNLEELKDLAKIAEKTEKGVASFAGDVIGTYNNAVDLVKATGDLVKTSDELPTELQTEFYKSIGERQDNLKGFQKMEKFLADKYNDPLSSDYDPVKFDLFRFTVEKRAAETILKSSAQNLSTNNDRIKIIDSLANKIDSTENIKDAQDLNNRLTSEILVVLTEMNNTFQQLAQLQAFGKYKGGTSKIAEDALRNSSNKKPLAWEKTLPPRLLKNSKEAENQDEILRKLPW